MKKKTELKSGRQTRHLATISEFITDIQHIDGKENDWFEIVLIVIFSDQAISF